MTRKSADEEVTAVELEQIEIETEEIKYNGTVLASEEKKTKPWLRIKHGKGVLHDILEGTRYEGQFSLNRKHGTGKLLFETTGDNYEG